MPQATHLDNEQLISFAREELHDESPTERGSGGSLKLVKGDGTGMHTA